MATRLEKNGDIVDIVIDGFEQGIAPSPNKGIAHIQGGNVSTELGEISVSFNRFQQSQTSVTGGTLSAGADNTHVIASSPLNVGTWITVTNDNPGFLSAGNYYVRSINGSSQYTLSLYYNGTAVTNGGSGSTGFSTSPNLGQAVASCIEQYSDGTVLQQRYYLLDNAGLVWVYDTANDSTSGLTWFLPDPTLNYYTGTAPTGIAVINGWLIVFAGAQLFCKQTVNLGDTTSTSTTWNQMAIFNTDGPAGLTTNPNQHYAITSHQGRVYYTDGQYIGSIFPDTTIAVTSGGPTENVQSFAKYTASGTTGTYSVIITGSVPNISNSSGSVRVPAVFFVPAGGTLPSALTADTVYWIDGDASTFQVYAAATGGAALNLQTGAVGTQYFNTLWFLGSQAPPGGSVPTCTLSPRRVNLPDFESAQCLVEINNTVLIGCKGNIIYPWDQVSVTPYGLIALPEANVQNMITVNQMAYIFAGNQGNIYITDGSTASLALNIPDYCAGIAGSPGTYIESTYTWGGAMYLRGRVYFSVLDQNSSKSGNCGGIWSFVPTQNFYIGQDIGLALRLEAQNSYANYNGVATVLIPRFNQNSTAPLYWSAWYSSVTSATYGIDYSNTGTNASFPCVVEFDGIPLATMLNKRTPQQIEYKLSAPLDVGATVTAKYRVNLTDNWTTVGTFTADPSALSGYVAAPFQQAQWAQLQFTLTPITSTANSNSYVRLKEVRIR